MSDGIVQNYISLLSLIVSVMSVSITAILTYIVYEKSNMSMEQREEESKRGITLNIVSKAVREIDESVGDKAILDQQYKPFRNQMFSYEYISKHKDVEKCVFSVLNEYDALSHGCCVNLLEEKVVRDIRGDALWRTHDQYSLYIKSYNKVNKKSGWEEFVKLAEKFKKVSKNSR